MKTVQDKTKLTFFIPHT